MSGGIPVLPSTSPAAAAAAKPYTPVWHVGILYTNIAAAGIALLSDFTTQVLIEGRVLRLRKKDKTKDKPQTASGAPPLKELDPKISPSSLSSSNGITEPRTPYSPITPVDLTTASTKDEVIGRVENMRAAPSGYVPKDLVAVGEDDASKAAAAEGAKEAVSVSRMFKFAGLNLLVVGPTTLWIVYMENTFPGKPLLQSAVTWILWDPVMFCVALLYRSVTTPPHPEESNWVNIKSTFGSDFKYLPFIYCYALPIVLLNFYVIPVEYVPVFMVVVDFISDMFGSWWLHRRQKAIQQQQEDVSSAAAASSSSSLPIFLRYPSFLALRYLPPCDRCDQKQQQQCAEVAQEYVVELERLLQQFQAKVVPTSEAAAGSAATPASALSGKCGLVVFDIGEYVTEFAWMKQRWYFESEAEVYRAQGNDRSEWYEHNVHQPRQEASVRQQQDPTFLPEAQTAATSTPRSTPPPSPRRHCQELQRSVLRPQLFQLRRQGSVELSLLVVDYRTQIRALLQQKPLLAMAASRQSLTMNQLMSLEFLLQVEDVLIQFGLEKEELFRVSASQLRRAHQQLN